MLLAKTIGNATFIAIDNEPVLATDPWLNGDEAYFGSWILPYEIPPIEKNEIFTAKYIFFSHGHPDHLNPHSIQHFKNQIILLPDHIGGRIEGDLNKQGFNVKILPDREWFELSKKIRIFCISDYNQDSILLIEINGHLFANLNDADPKGSMRLLRRIIKKYKNSYMLKLTGYGDADMINFYDESGAKVEPKQNSNAAINLLIFARLLGTNHAIPFSCFHTYQREDSLWTNDYTTSKEAMEHDFIDEHIKYIKPFSIIDCSDENQSQFELINPKKIIVEPKSPEAFGDSWSEGLLPKDEKELLDYFMKRKSIHHFYDFLNFHVGGSDFQIKLNGPKGKGITFEVPRNSLMTAIKYEIFDDLMIGNFMKTTLHQVRSLYDPEFNYYVCKWADNGKAYSEEDIKKYMKIYRRRAGYEFIEHLIEMSSAKLLRRYVNKNSKVYEIAKNIYTGIR